MNSAAHRHTQDPNKKPQGVETYILNPANQRSKRLAELQESENPVLEGSQAGVVQKKDVALILKDLMLDASSQGSKELACTVQNELVKATTIGKRKKRRGRHKRNRGVKRSLFYVLMGADMPSILVETGFLDHRHDRALVTGSRGRQKIAAAIAKAILRYQKKKSDQTCYLR